ncbi:energy transducer TonB [Spirosoma areae]
MQTSFFFCHRDLSGMLVTTFWLLLLTTVGFAQKTDTTIYTVVEQQPVFPGGFDAMKKYLLTNVHYPPEARKASVKDRVLMSFVVELDGSITYIQLVKGIGYGCDEEAIRVVRAMPRWTPGSQSGKLLRVKFHLPVLFGIAYEEAKRR